jgi:hypothetical protein
MPMQHPSSEMRLRRVPNALHIVWQRPSFPVMPIMNSIKSVLHFGSQQKGQSGLCEVCISVSCQASVYDRADISIQIGLQAQTQIRRKRFSTSILQQNLRPKPTSKRSDYVPTPRMSRTGENRVCWVLFQCSPTVNFILIARGLH